jgi:hypothetical protein
MGRFPKPARKHDTMADNHYVQYNGMMADNLNHTN